MVQWKRGGEGRLSEVLENRTWGAQKGVLGVVFLEVLSGGLFSGSLRGVLGDLL